MRRQQWQRETCTMRQLTAALSDLANRCDEVGPDTPVLCAGHNDTGVPVEFFIEGFSAQQADGEAFVAVHIKKGGVLITGRGGKHMTVTPDGAVVPRE